jgi:hypothetical protein
MHSMTFHAQSLTVCPRLVDKCSVDFQAVFVIVVHIEAFFFAFLEQQLFYRQQLSNTNAVDSGFVRMSHTDQSRLDAHPQPTCPRNGLPLTRRCVGSGACTSISLKVDFYRLRPQSPSSH